MTNERDRPDGPSDEQTDPYLWDGSGEPDPLVARLESALAAARWNADRGGAKVSALAAPRRRISWRSGLALAASLVMVAAGLWRVLAHESPTGWKVEPVSGSPVVNDRALASAAPMKSGQWLRTDASSSALLRGEGVGTIDVAPDSDLRLLKASATEHRLELARGSISAFVTTPPRVFFVDTPAATAVDMGCQYKLKVDQAGEGVLYVTLGWVELHEGGREVRVPAGAACRIGGKTGPAPGPGTPWFEDAEPGFAAAVARLDAGAANLDEVLRGARRRDSLTVWHLVGGLQGTERARAAARLAELVAPPPGVPVSMPTASDLERWWGAVRASW